MVNDAGGFLSRSGGSGLVIHWSGRDAPPGHISLPELVDGNILRIRAEHEAWAYEMGGLPVRAPWRRSLEDALRGFDGALSMWWCSLLYERHPRMLPGLYDVYRLRALELALQQHEIGGLLALGPDKRLDRTLADFCRRAGISYRKGGQRRAKAFALPTARSLYMLLPAPLRALARYAHWWFAVRRRLPPAGDALPATGGRPDASIITYFPNIDMHAAGEGRFRSRYWESLHDALNAEARREKPGGGHFVHWIFIRFPAPQLSFSQCLELRDLFRREGRDGLSFHYLEEFLRPSDLFRSIWRHATLCLTSLAAQGGARRAFSFPGSKMNFWRQMKWAWEESFRGWRCLERSLQNRAFMRFAALAGPQRWYLFPLENCPWERMLCHAVRGQWPGSTRGPLIGAQHSTIRRTDFRYFDDPRTFSDTGCGRFQPDLVRANGRGALVQWQDAGVPPDRLGQVEALRYLYLARRGEAAGEGVQGPWRSGPRKAAPEFPTALDMARAMGKKGRLLVLTSFFRGETDEHLALLSAALRGGLLDDWEITVKAHPYLPVRERLENQAGALARRISYAEGSLELELRPGVSVWASNSTTGALEAALRGLPVMVMQARDDFDLCPIQDVPGLLRTSCLEDVASALRDLRPIELPRDYLDLDIGLKRWKALLGL